MRKWLEELIRLKRGGVMSDVLYYEPFPYLLLYRFFIFEGENGRFWWDKARSFGRLYFFLGC
jgi:hypothetical protein